MTCYPLGTGFACSPNGGRYQRLYGTCGGACGAERTARLVVSQGSPWYAPTVHCVDCGDAWSEGELLERPFKRAWRKEAIARYEAMWEAGCECPVELDEDLYALPCSEHSALGVLSHE